MSIGQVITGGFGNGTLAGSIPGVVLLGFTIGSLYPKTLKLAAENRTLKMSREDRTLILKAENRTIKA